MVETTCNSSTDLFKGLHKFNPNSAQQLKAIGDAMEAVTMDLEGSCSPPLDVAEQAEETQVRSSDPCSHTLVDLERIGLDVFEEIAMVKRRVRTETGKVSSEGRDMAMRRAQSETSKVATPWRP